ncbi:MAG: peptide-methionine (S)-S-oxide reductase MsrA [Actinomycetales bacterium]|nr:peptide-methionine (S)-S-oxide reductase MsrA [Actinomycetales bacterium]
MVSATEALAGRSEPIVVDRPHLVLGTDLDAPVDPAHEVAYLAMGCFWGAERLFYRLAGVVSTSVGYQGGFTPNPTYREVCTGLTGHAETVRVVFDPSVLSYSSILAAFFEGHDPTQGHRQGNDVGTQYRSAVFTTSKEQSRIAVDVAARYQGQLLAAGFGPITTEIEPAGPFYLAEEYHQQYLQANPDGYCGIGGTGVSCPIGLLGR